MDIQKVGPFYVDLDTGREFISTADLNEMYREWDEREDRLRAYIKELETALLKAARQLDAMDSKSPPTG